MELIGRSDDLADIVNRLRTRRLVTITGPGGIGKTTLATKAANEAELGNGSGRFVVDLTRVDRSEAVAEAVAGQLGFSDFASFLGAPGEHAALLVFDNCEHVLDAAAEVARQILQSSELPRILATSRSPLDLPDESILTLGPLEVPQPEADEVTAALRLFLDRARDQGREPTGEALRGAAEICRRLDGVPLALEIAAARLRSMTVAELLDEIEARPHELARPRFRGKPTHRSVADMVGWSIDLLDAHTGRFFDRLSLFNGPFTASMAHAVASDQPEDRGGTGDLLDELVAASLVAADTSGDLTRYRLLLPIRAVAADRFATATDAADRRSRWIDHIVELALDVILANGAGWSADLLSDLLALYDNLVAALRSMLSEDDTADPEAPHRPLLLLAVLWGVVHQSHTEEITTLGEAVLARWNDPDAQFWADAVATVATGRNLLGQHESAIELAQAAFPHATGSPAAPASLLRVQAQAHRALGDRARSCELFEAGALAAEGLESHGMAMEQWVDHAVLLAENGDPDAGLQVIDRVIAEADEHDAKINLAWALTGRGLVLRAAGSDDAATVLEEALSESQRIAYPAGISASLRSLALVYVDRGEHQAAASAIGALLDDLVERGGLNDLRMAVEVAATIAEAVGDSRWPDLAVTAESLTVTTVITPVSSEIFDRARSSGRELSARDAFVLCRSAMTDIATDRREPSPPAAMASDASTGSLVREGDTWRLTYHGRTCVLRSSKGLADLATLLERPQRDVAAIDLAQVEVVGETRDEVIDAAARRDHEERIRDLQRELEEAEATNDLGTSERLQTELDVLIDQLSSAVGLGGRSRRSANGAERARSAVTQRLRGTIKRVATELPELGDHLRASISTGTYCCYRPPTPTDWTIER